MAVNWVPPMVEFAVPLKVTVPVVMLLIVVFAGRPGPETLIPTERFVVLATTTVEVPDVRLPLNNVIIPVVINGWNPVSTPPNAAEPPVAL